MEQSEKQAVDQSMEQTTWSPQGPGPVTRSCRGSRHSFDAGFGGCDAYGRSMHRYCGTDLDDKQGYYAEQVCDECNVCSGSASSVNRIVRSYGDPHMQNILGQRFDIVRPGVHILVQIPKHRTKLGTLLRVSAQVSKVGDSCQDMYILKVNVTGIWLESSGRRLLHFDSGVAQPELDSKWLHFGAVDLKVAQGKTVGGKKYLNLFVRNLAKTSYSVGGLLGEDSHELETTPTESCRKSISLLEVSEVSASSDAYSRSVAVAL